MTDLLRLSIALVLLAISLCAFFLVLGAFFPSRIARTAAIARARPGRAFLIGLVNGGFFGALALACLALAERASFLAVPGLALAAVLAGGLSFGLAGMVEIAGERLAPQAGPRARTVWGTLALALGCALPFAGWFGLLGYAGLTGLGAFIAALFQREPER